MIPTVLFVLLGSAAAIVAPVLVLFQIPKWRHSVFRDELWSIRDDLVDALLVNKLDLNPVVDGLLLRVNLAIRYSSEHTLRSLVMGVLYMSRTRTEPSESIWKELDASTMPDDQKLIVTGLLQRFEDAMVQHLIWGSPSGWLGAILVSFLGDARSRAENEINRLPTSYPGEHPTGRDLVACT